MKRLTTFLSLVVCGVLLATAVAFMQSDSRPQFSAPQDYKNKPLHPTRCPKVISIKIGCIN